MIEGLTELLHAAYGAPHAALVVDCPPGIGMANIRYRARSNKALSDAYKSFRQYVWVAWHHAGRPVLTAGLVRVHVRHYWSEARVVECEGLPSIEVAAGDVDGLGKSVLDALEHAGAFGVPKPKRKTFRAPGVLYGDDARAKQLIEESFVDARERVEIDLWQL